ncbi:carbohydrate kinase family protein [Psychrobacillus antarcticus]|uniref:carbohydrate kinase family protein n=1 Tax=Psychrobacillus antarcticus TaxID=2879115 RepID=UPI002407C78A|nr:carbohydrate kinase [Psychrobacillus antarcticus]
MSKKFVLIYGDAFVDYIAEDQSNSRFSKYLGGATVNVAAGVARLGAASSFITVTGENETSEFVRNELIAEGVNLSFSQIMTEKEVSGVYVHLLANNERHFERYVDATPDIQVDFSSINSDAILQTSVFHFCSGTLFHPTALATTRKLVQNMKKSNVLISFDANIRPLRWKSEETCRETISSFFEFVDILKLTEEELFFLTKKTTIEDGIAQLQQYNIEALLITIGAEGTHAVINGEEVHVPVEKVTPIDTTGAGDAFVAGILSKIYLEGQPTSKEAWTRYIAFGNKLGAICATKPGALSAMPRLIDLKQ